MHHSLTRPRWALVSILPLPFALGLAIAALAVQPGGLAFAAGGAIVAIVVSVRKPEASLALGVTAGLVSEPYSFVSQAGYVLLVLSAVALAFVAARSPNADKHLHYGDYIPYVLLLLLATRLAFESGVDAILPVIPCIAAVSLTFSRHLDLQRLKTALSWVGVAFIIFSVLFGQNDPFSGRYEGVSGNPNRLAFGMLFFLPFIVAEILRHRSTLARLMLIGGCLTAVILTLRTGSEQGVAGLGILVLLLGAYWTKQIQAVKLIVTLSSFGVMAIWFALATNLLVGLSSDTLSLSGRVQIFQSGIEQIGTAPWIGSGTTRVVESLAEVSAHNSIIGIAVTAGVLAGAAWLSILGRVLFASIRQIRQGEIAAAAGISVVVSQLVQSIEYLPATWCALCLVLSMQRDRKTVHND